MLSVMLGSMMLALGVPEDELDEVYTRFLKKYSADQIPSGFDPPSVIVNKIKAVM